MDGLASLPNPDVPWQAVMAMCLFSMISAWINWGLSLIASAMFALFLVRRNPKTDYRLLVASAYLGLGCTWHSGLSGSAPLLVNTPNNFLIQGKILETTIPTTETIFTAFNLILTVIVIVVVTVLMCLMHPRPEKTYKIKPELLSQLTIYEGPERPTGKLSFADWANWWPGFNIIVGLAGLLWLSWEVAAKGLAGSINLNNINLFFLMLGLLFHWRPWSFLKAAEDAGKAVWGVIIQFPFLCGYFRPVQIHCPGHGNRQRICGHFQSEHLPPHSLLVFGNRELSHTVRRLQVCHYRPLYSRRGKDVRSQHSQDSPDLCLGGYDDGHDSAVLGDSDAGSGQTRIPRDHGLAYARVLCFLYYHVDRVPDLAIRVVMIAGEILLTASIPRESSTYFDD